MTDTGASSAIRLLVVDEQPLVRQGLLSLVASRHDLTVVAQAGDGEQAVNLYREHRPDVVLMDVHLPILNGLTALKAIRAEFPGARVILLASHDTGEDVYRGLQAGAMGYLPKNTVPDGLFDAIRRVHTGLKAIPPEIGAKLADRVATTTLSEREQEVLDELARGKSNREIGRSLFIAEATVKFHINRILAKLEAQDRTQAVLTALRRGLISLN
jgi:two-component system NarL family response regulator